MIDYHFLISTMVEDASNSQIEEYLNNFYKQIHRTRIKFTF